MAGGDGAVSMKLTTDEKIAETSSKGNQEKWLENGKWYKLDQFGYEALSEVMTSRILERSNIETETPFTFVRYEMQKVKVHKLEFFKERSVHYHGQRAVSAVVGRSADKTARQAAER